MDLDIISYIAPNKYEYAYIYQHPDTDLYHHVDIKHTFNRNAVENAVDYAGVQNLKTYQTEFDTLDDALIYAFSGHPVQIIDDGLNVAIKHLNDPGHQNIIAFKHI